ncbi:MAG: P63C domain-containing protein [Clostridium sp.]|uniref:P63C domain-containing protein n=1 Tax=Clostridium sp. TaxID=1506 RepID=UPI0029034B91|nr:P63C domain-containing protein [Clostridium sp.]MDU2895708.1 P63C domain-containing protein [Clostridium sp.]MDU3008100.1 P63C domain-containing protein [Clostridium sp.]MDU3037951.1 P63C domain-containing protein [Clostridium sp.]MDU3052933.1 P63C domain-containing protein [Clostridium sp.]
METINNDILKATHFGIIKIGEKELNCAVLENGSRILSKTAVFTAFERTQRGRKKDEVRVPSKPNLPSFIDAKNLSIYISDELEEMLINPIKYKTKNGRIVDGYSAEIIPLLCDVYLQARIDNKLTIQQQSLALASEILVRSLSKIGIVALVDEATGYQYDRDRDELQKILSLYISKELLPWTKRFPDEFYKQMFRLKNWTYPRPNSKRPGIVGTYTNKYVYDLLPPGVKEELQRVNPTVKPGRRKHKHHQFLTEDIGNDNLKNHLIKVITLMQASKDWKDFNILFNRAFNIPQQLELDYED